MKKKYFQPTTKAIRVRIENHIAQLSGGGNDTFTAPLGNEEGNGGDDVLGKDDIDFGW